MEEFKITVEEIEYTVFLHSANPEIYDVVSRATQHKFDRHSLGELVYIESKTGSMEIHMATKNKMSVALDERSENLP